MNALRGLTRGAPEAFGHSTHSGHPIQCLEPDDSEYYVPDRIIRFTGDASPKDPWPEEEAQQKNGEDDAQMDPQ